MLGNLLYPATPSRCCPTHFSLSTEYKSGLFKRNSSNNEINLNTSLLIFLYADIMIFMNATELVVVNKIISQLL